MPSPLELSHRTRTQNLATIGRETFDLLVIGGGITGAGIARDAALRGLSVALVERRDFACGTSSRSSKLIHGGVRYLALGDVGLVLEAASERRVVRRLAPHLARPMQMLVPIYSRGGYAKLSVGLLAYDRLAKVNKDERYQMLDRDAALAREPALRAAALYGAATYYEYVTDDARLVIATIKSAAALGAVVANYAEVVGFVTENERVVGATVRDGATGAELTARARVIVNAAGPWVDEVRLLFGRGEQRRLHPSKGIHVVVPHQRLPVSRIVVMQTSDKRSAFCVPHGATVYLGTTDTDYTGPLDEPQITRDDVHYLLDAANATFAVAPLSDDDVVGAWAGLRPLLHEPGKKPTELSRKDEIMVNAGGLISIAGGKLTTFRKMAERIGAMVETQLREHGRPAPTKRGDSDAAPLCGGDTGDNLADYAARLHMHWPMVPRDVVDRLAALYGSEAEIMVKAMATDASLRQRCSPSLAVTRGEIDYALRCEMVMELDDFLERRSRLMLFDVDNGLTAAQPVAEVIGATLGWSPAQIADAVTRYQSHVAEVKSFQSEPLAASPASTAHA